jgi:hypothetical protein
MRRLWILISFFAWVCGAQAATPVTPATYVQPPFPRLSVGLINNQNYQEASVQKMLALGSFAVISTWPGWQNDGTTLNEAIQKIKALNPSELILQYDKNNEFQNNQATGAESAVWDKLNAMHWWLYADRTSGAPIPSNEAGNTEVNNTTFTQKDANGYNWNTWYAHWIYTNLYQPSPLLDGFMTDNVYLKPWVAGDWNLSGTTTPTSSPNAALWAQQGYVQYFDTLKQLMPGKFQLGNIAQWGAGDLSLYNGMLNGGVLEGLIGVSWSAETWGGWKTVIAYVNNAMGALAEPKLLVFSQYGSVTDYQSFRYGLATCMMTNAYFQFTGLTASGSADNATIPWFDEYAWRGQLGNATTAPPTTAWQNGVYRRDFQNGIALVNPKGNGAQTVTLETNYVRLNSKCSACQNQAPTVNSGQVVKTLTLQDRDGIILLKEGVPAAPTITSVQ